MTQQAIPQTPGSTQDAGVVAFVPNVRQRLPRIARVRAKADFERVFNAGKRTAEPRLALHWLADDAAPRLGLAVSRKVDSRAVGRNRIKRCLREAFRQWRPMLRPGAYVVVARSSAAQANRDALRAAFEQLLLRAGALPPSPVAGTMPPATSSPSSPVAAP
ncbi:ribonuclease P protein component [Thermomonas paludicola]|uniref:ribonuclease P protein component n=1 Tax=Thermomonas paludicola TaxID=2884874 RepID=UPI002113EB98|nr:ribonuclease P protein component [Thermomonas paludicola]